MPLSASLDAQCCFHMVFSRSHGTHQGFCFSHISSRRVSRVWPLGNVIWSSRYPLNAFKWGNPACWTSFPSLAQRRSSHSANRSFSKSSLICSSCCCATYSMTCASRSCRQSSIKSLRLVSSPPLNGHSAEATLFLECLAEKASLSMLPGCPDLFAWIPKAAVNCATVLDNFFF